MVIRLRSWEPEALHDTDDGHSSYRYALDRRLRLRLAALTSGYGEGNNESSEYMTEAHE